MKNQNIGRMLRYYRKANEFSVKYVVEALANNYDVKISPKTLYSWENSQNIPSADHMLMLCQMYQVPDIMRSAGFEDATEPPLDLTPEEREVILRYRAEKYYQDAVKKLLDIKDTKA